MIGRSGGITDKCFFVSYTSEIQNYYALIDVFFFPSKLEGYPNVVVEALLSGLPVLASSIPQIVELKKDYPSIQTFNLDEKDMILDLVMASCVKKSDEGKTIHSPSSNYDKFLRELQ